MSGQRGAISILGLHSGSALPHMSTFSPSFDVQYLEISHLLCILASLITVMLAS
jgi:hypothetical protein